MATPFFQASRRFINDNTALFDFVGPARCAFWNMRADVAGYVAQFPGAKRDDLQARFVHGSQIHGVNVERAFLESDPTNEEGTLAQLTLFSCFALYEGYLNELCSSFQRPRTIEKRLQFPSRGHSLSPRRDGFREALAEVTATASPAMAAAFPPVLRRVPRYSLAQIDHLLTVYRYFKEIRNSLAHSRATAGSDLEAASREIAALTASDLGTRSVPEHRAYSSGDDVLLSLRGAIGFTDVLLRIVITIDAEVAGTVLAEREFLARWRRRYPSLMTLPGNADRRNRRVTYCCNTLGFPTPHEPAAIYSLLRDEALVY